MLFCMDSPSECLKFIKIFLMSWQFVFRLMKNFRMMIAGDFSDQTKFYQSY